MLKLKKSCPYFRRVHEITLKVTYLTERYFDKILTDIVDHFKPRVLQLSTGNRRELFISKNTKVQWRVPELTIDSRNDMVESILSKVIPTHSLRIDSPCKLD